MHWVVVNWQRIYVERTIVSQAHNTSGWLLLPFLTRPVPTRPEPCRPGPSRISIGLLGPPQALPFRLIIRPLAPSTPKTHPSWALTLVGRAYGVGQADRQSSFGLRRQSRKRHAKWVLKTISHHLWIECIYVWFQGRKCVNITIFGEDSFTRCYTLIILRVRFTTSVINLLSSGWKTGKRGTRHLT